MLFENLNLIPQIKKALVKCNYEIATPIQAQAIPHVLAGSDLLGIAQTGTGKTAAFLIPLLQLLYNLENKNLRYPQILILAPTRELASQIGNNIREYSQFLDFKYSIIFGGVSQVPQEKALNRNLDIIVATPGRLLDLMKQGKVNLTYIQYFVLDEADRMLDMGFINDVKKIIAVLPKKKQTLFFSATMSKPILELSKSILINPKKVEVTPESKTIDKIDQSLYYVDTVDKDKLLLESIASKNISSVLVFTRTKHKANKIAVFLNNNNVTAEAIHGNKSQNHRTKTLTDFKSGKLKVLVATEIVARGIDIDDISLVVNYEIPNEPESYVHRIGRTARAGKSGIAISFCAADEREYINEIERIIKKKIPVASHKMHSDTAQNAKGAAAKPLPKSQQQNRNFNKSKKSKKPNVFAGKNKNFKRSNSRY